MTLVGRRIPGGQRPARAAAPRESLPAAAREARKPLLRPGLAAEAGRIGHAAAREARRPLLRLLAVALVGALLPVAAPRAAAQEAPGERVTVWDGVYTAEQAARGRAVYDSFCASCHGADLSGSSEARPLAGERFMQDWSEDHLGNLFTRIQRLMPYDDPGALDADAYLDSLAYILEFNGFPAGSAALRADRVDAIRIEGRDGPGPVPSFALVQVVGCLTAGPEGGWMLTRGTRAVRTREPSASGAEALGALDDQPLGDRTFTLMSAYPDPSPHAGHKMEAKGFLIRDPAGDRINLSSLQPVAERCAP